MQERLKLQHNRIQQRSLVYNLVWNKFLSLSFETGCMQSILKSLCRCSKIKEIGYTWHSFFLSLSFLTRLCSLLLSSRSLHSPPFPFSRKLPILVFHVGTQSKAICPSQQVILATDDWTRKRQLDRGCQS